MVHGFIRPQWRRATHSVYPQTQLEERCRCGRRGRPDGNGVNGAEWMGLNMREGRGRMRRQPRIMAPLISVAASNAALPERRFMHARGV